MCSLRAVSLYPHSFLSPRQFLPSRDQARKPWALGALSGWGWGGEGRGAPEGRSHVWRSRGFQKGKSQDGHQVAALLCREGRAAPCSWAVPPRGAGSGTSSRSPSPSPPRSPRPLQQLPRTVPATSVSSPCGPGGQPRRGERGGWLQIPQGQSAGGLRGPEAAPGAAWRRRPGGLCFPGCAGPGGGRQLRTRRERTGSSARTWGPSRGHRSPIASAGGEVSEVNPRKVKAGPRAMAREEITCVSAGLCKQSVNGIICCHLKKKREWLSHAPLHRPSQPPTFRALSTSPLART